MARTARLSVEIDGRGARRGASAVNSELARLKGEARGVAREFDALGRAAQIAVGYFGIAEFRRLADEATNVRSRLNALSSSTAELAQHQRTVSELARETRSELNATSQLYATLTRSGKDLGLSQQEIARITETVNKSFAITGTDSVAASQAIRQLSQAFQSGVLRGDEFNTMAEAAPVLMDALAASLGKPRSELRALAEEGELTVDKLVTAFSDQKITSGIDAQFAKTIPTIAQRMQLLENAAVEAIGRFDELTGATATLGKGIELLADNLRTIIPIATALGVAFAVRLAVGAIQARLAIVTMSAAAAGAQAPLAALGFTARAAGSALLGAFGGPIGAAITGLTVVIGGLAAEAANAQLRLNEANGTLAESARSLAETEERARRAGVQTAFVGTAASSATQKFGGLPAILSIVARRFGDVGNNAKYAAEQMVRAKLVEANTEIAALEKAQADRRPQAYRANQGSFENAIGNLARFIAGGIEGATGQTDAREKTLAARRKAAANFKRELELILATPESAFVDSAPGLSGGGDSSGSKRSRGGSSNAAQEAKQLASFAKQAADQIVQMREQYDGTASDVGQVNQAMRTLDELIAELTERKPPNFEKLVADAKELKPLLTESLRKPIAEMLLDQERQIELARLQRDGRIEERDQLELQYQLMQRLGVESEEQLATALAKRGITAAEYQDLFNNLSILRQLSAEEERRNQIIQERLRVVEDFRQNIEQTIAELPTKGLGAIGNFFKDLMGQFRQYFARQLTESLFGGAFKELQAEISGKKDLVEAESKATDASLLMAKSIVDTVKKLETLGNAAAGAANGLAGTTVANDNDTDASTAANEIAKQIDIIVDGRKNRNNDFDVFARTFQKLFETFLGKDSPLAASLGKIIGQALKDAAVGQTASTIFGQVFGVKQSNTGAAIGGAIGGAIGSAVGGPIGQAVGSALGGILGGTVGGLFKKAKVGTASLSFDAGTGELGTAIGGNNGKAKGQAAGLGDSLVGGLQRIADQLGATLTGSGSVSIGVRDGKIRVDTTGKGNTKTKKGAIDFGEDEEAAIKFAIQDAIKDGVLAGLRAGTLALLQSGKDIEVQLEKAMKFEDVFRQLRAIDDPVGAAVEAVNKEFQGLIKIFKEAGATAAEYADLERLYQIKRTEAIDEANERMLGSMRDYLFQLTAGPQSVLSPQLRYQNSLAELNSLDAKRAAGQNVDFNQYRTVADAFLASSRDYQGSTTGFFADMQRITNTVQNWITSEQSRTSNLPTLDFQPVTTAIENQTTVQTAILQQISSNIAALGINIQAMNDNFQTANIANLGSPTRYYQNF